MNYFNEETIAAIASAPEAVAAVGVIRISGASAWEKTAPLLEKIDGSKFDPSQVQSHHLYRCVLRSARGPLDDGMFVWMKGPHSFTGEHVVELHLHGNPYLLRKVMRELLAQGAREALPGEFSFRAFRNGKLSLEQAESVADLIGSQSEESARRALDQLMGSGKRELELLKKEIIDRLAEIEVDIDFSDQGLSVLDYDKWSEKLRRWQERVAKLRQEFVDSQPLREGIRLALVGAPNSGKSSLFNRLLGEDRSIVSTEAGTTRDVVREALYLKGLLFRLSDTAGLRDTENLIESQGIDRSYGELRSAQVAVWIFDGMAQDEDFVSRWQILQKHLPSQAKVLAVWNKADQVPMPPELWLRFFQTQKIPLVAVSALTGQGIDEFINQLCGIFQTQRLEGQDFFLNRWRHYEVLGAASEAVDAALEKVKKGEIFPDLLSTDLRMALAKIGEITGEFSSEDLLHHIFAEFCIGK